jgi:creatinine amidohydrolase
MTTYLADLTKDDLATLFAGSSRVVALVPVGSVEPHGPHLPLATDTIISRGASERAVLQLAQRDVVALVAPSIPYGVTRFAAGFSGAVSVSEDALAAWIAAVGQALLDAGFRHVCFVNNHLEPEHDLAVRQGAERLPEGRASVACPLKRRWARMLSAEFKSGACHAGRYETSLVLATEPEVVAADVARTLPEVPISLSDGIRSGALTFREMGMAEAYAGSPALATADEGREQLDLLAEMITTEVLEGIERGEPSWG